MTQQGTPSEDIDYLRSQITNQWSNAANVISFADQRQLMERVEKNYLVYKMTTFTTVLFGSENP